MVERTPGERNDQVARSGNNMMHLLLGRNVVTTPPKPLLYGSIGASSYNTTVTHAIGNTIVGSSFGKRHVA